MSNQSSSSSYPPRSSSITKANEVLEQVNAMSTPPNQNLPRRFFNKILATTSSSGSSRETNARVQEIGGTSCIILPKGPQVAAGAVAPAPSSHIYDINKYGRPNTSSPGLLSETEPKGGRSSSRSLHQRHSSFVPLTRLYGKPEEIQPQQITPASHERIAHPRQSQNLLPLHSATSPSQSSLAIKESRENSIPFTRQSPGYVNTSGPLEVYQLRQTLDCGRLEPGVKQVLPRPDTGTSLASESCYQSEASEAGNTSKSKLAAWSMNPKKWGFRGNRSKEKDSPKESDDDLAERKISWRKSTADLLLGYTGGDRKSEERDGLFWKKSRQTEAYSPQQSPTPEMSLAGSSSYESLNGLMQNVSPASGQAQPANARLTEDTQPSNLCAINLGKSSTLPLNILPKDNLDLKGKLHAGNAEGTDQKMELSSYPSSVSSIPSRSTSLMNPFTPVTNPPTGASSLEELSLGCANLDSDEESDIDIDGGGEDETITLKTHQKSLKMPQTGKTDNLLQISLSSESDIYTIFHDTTSLSYGTFIKLLQITVTGQWADGQTEGGGRKCFHLILSFVSAIAFLPPFLLKPFLSFLYTN